MQQQEMHDKFQKAWFHFIVAGEGFHLNHHKDPSNYTTLLPNHKWWEIDLTGLFIKMIRI